ncbi:MAG: glycosyltransferase family 4 protein [Candidatus Thiodiazotropha sp. (ex Codakia rugifera)]|nr:glycosyltransferase family 4 protein [Candidatus Thiodiazotropha sp. (ex Codakia rugifera)]
MNENKQYNILLVHNRYQQYGGEDTVVEAEMKLLKDNGHTVNLYTRDNHEINGLNNVKLLIDGIWSRKTISDFKKIFLKDRPDIIHVHNTFPLISPSIYWAASFYNVPIIQTIHNFRLSCIQAMFLREKKICEDCLAKSPWRGIARKCYRGSMLASMSAAAILQFHRMIGTYEKKVTTYIALNKFCKNKLVEMGLPEDKISIKPNFVTLKNNGSRTKRNGNPLFVGRLSEEKGISTLAQSIKSLPNQIFDIVGNGPEKHILESINNVRMIGSINQDDVYDLMQKAPFLVLPSIWYENMPRTLVESFGNGTPVIASSLGALTELVEHGRTGLLFKPGSSDELTREISWALENTKEMDEMGRNARNVYEVDYTGSANYKILLNIMQKSMDKVQKISAK